MVRITFVVLLHPSFLGMILDNYLLNASVLLFLSSCDRLELISLLRSCRLSHDASKTQLRSQAKSRADLYKTPILIQNFKLCYLLLCANPNIVL